MSNYFEYGDKVAFHPGYYIKEIVAESGLTQEDFAKRLDTTPKNLSLLIRGEQSLSVDIAMKLSRMIGTSISHWLNLQTAYDAVIAKLKSEEELENEIGISEFIDYKYFRENFGLPDLPRKISEQTEKIRNFLNVATLSVFKKRDMAVSFRGASADMAESNIVKANVMVQIATNIALKTNAPKYGKALFEDAARYALTLTEAREDFFRQIRDAFFKAGVVLVVVPDMPGAIINSAAKKVRNNIMLMVNDRRLWSDRFWFTLFHEIGHILNGDFGISFDAETGEQEDVANKYAEDMLIPCEQYQSFIDENRFDSQSVRAFAKSINRDPGIVLGRLQNDKKVAYGDSKLSEFRRQYMVREF